MQEFLNWRTDPLLLDPTSMKQNDWQTANELLETGQSDSFLTAAEQLRLYPIMVRKIDFVSGERIMQSFPYIALDQEWILRIRKQSLGLDEDSFAVFGLLNDEIDEDVVDNRFKDSAPEIVKILQDSTVIDWITKDDIQRRMRKKLKLLLIKKKYPKDKVEPVIYRILDLARIRFRR